MLRIQVTDILEHSADAIVFTVDGTGRGLEGQVARAFASRWPDAFEQAQADVSYPLALGSAHGVRISYDCRYRGVIFAATLHHVDVLENQAKGEVCRRAFESCLHEGKRLGCQSIASVLLRGGWRLQAVDAFMQMVRAMRTARTGIDVDLCIADEEQAWPLQDKLSAWSWYR